MVTKKESKEAAALQFSQELAKELQPMYKYCGGHVDTVIDIIKEAYEKSHWIEFPMGDSDESMIDD